LVSTVPSALSTMPVPAAVPSLVSALMRTTPAESAALTSPGWPWPAGSPPCGSEVGRFGWTGSLGWVVVLGSGSIVSVADRLAHRNALTPITTASTSATTPVTRRAVRGWVVEYWGEYEPCG
jgi:hypothetical protein